MPASYSGTPLVRKLGLEPGQRARFIGAPPGYDRTLGPLPKDVKVVASTRGPLDFVQLFVTCDAELRRRPPVAKRALAQDGALWVSWPKRASGVAGDVTENVVRRQALRAGLVDVKVCAVDETWSGLKLVHRLEDR